MNQIPMVLYYESIPTKIMDLHRLRLEKNKNEFNPDGNNTNKIKPYGTNQSNG